MTGMIDQVERKIEEFDRISKQNYYKTKEADLIAWGLTTQTKGKKVVPIIVTDEEYEMLKQAAKGTEYAGKGGKSKLAQLLNIIAVVVAVCGIIAGLVMYAVYDNLSFVKLSLCWGGSLAFSVIFLGLAEVISLLNRLLDK